MKSNALQSAVLYICKNRGVNDLFSHSFPLWGLLLWWSLAHKKKHTLVFAAHCTHTTAVDASMERTVRQRTPNYSISTPPLTTEATLASFWALLYGKRFSQDGIFQPLTIKWMDFDLWIFCDLQRKEGGGASVTSISPTSTVCYYGNPRANAVSLAIYQGAGCHATIPCVIIKWIQTQMQLL